MLRDAVAAGALESSVETGESLAAELVRAVETVAVVVATVAARNAFAVRGAAEFRGRAVAVLVATEFVVFVVAVGAIVFKIAGPSTRDASFVLALELGSFVAFRALFG